MEDGQLGMMLMKMKKITNKMEIVSLVLHLKNYNNRVVARKVKVITKKKMLTVVLIQVPMNQTANRNLVKKDFLGMKWKKEPKWKTEKESREKFKSKKKISRKRDDLNSILNKIIIKIFLCIYTYSLIFPVK
jgi:hypothetical protein